MNDKELNRKIQRNKDFSKKMYHELEVSKGTNRPKWLKGPVGPTGPQEVLGFWEKLFLIKTLSSQEKCIIMYASRSTNVLSCWKEIPPKTAMILVFVVVFFALEAVSRFKPLKYLLQGPSGKVSGTLIMVLETKGCHESKSD